MQRAQRAASGPLYQAENDQQDHRADDAAADHDAELRQQPTADEGADDADDDIADQPEAEPGDDHAGEPARDRADDEQNDDTLQIHGVVPQIAVLPRRQPLITIIQ